MSFEGKVVLITGASSGIGAGAAIHLSRLGASVAIVGRDAEKLNHVTQQIHEAGSPEPLEIIADLTTDAERIICETIDRFGKLDVLVNNAGILINSGEILDNLEVFDRTMNVNVRSVLQLTKLALPYLEESKGNIVNTSSILGSVAFPSGIAYAMSKAAIDHFTRCAALDLASKGIRVNAVCPGIVITPLFETMGMDAEAREQLFETSKETYPLGRVGNVDDISNSIAFLANDAASHITGILLTVDGGKHLVKY